MENAEKGFFNLVFGEPAGKVLGLTNVELATRLADKDVDSEHKKEEIGSSIMTFPHQKVETFLEVAIARTPEGGRSEAWRARSSHRS